MNGVRQRTLISGITVGLVGLACVAGAGERGPKEHRPQTRPPNILFVLADQWRAEAFGYAGNPDVKTPNLDRLQREGIHFANAVSGMPVCCPMRASFLTGQRPLTHGVFLNDVPLNPEAVTIAKVLGAAGYDTAYIGKWHVNAHGRSNFIPRERRQGFGRAGASQRRTDELRRSRTDDRALRQARPRQ